MTQHDNPYGQKCYEKFKDKGLEWMKTEYAKLKAEHKRILKKEDKCSKRMGILYEAIIMARDRDETHPCYNPSEGLICHDWHVINRWTECGEGSQCDEYVERKCKKCGLHEKSHVGSNYDHQSGQVLYDIDWNHQRP